MTAPHYIQHTAVIAARREIAPGVWDILLDTPIAALAAPGQFVNIRCGAHTLRRPISIAGIDKESGQLRLIFEVRGGGTAQMAQRQTGESLDLIGPLGRGWPLVEPSSRAVLVGGGIGTPPLLPLAQYYGENAAVITGFRGGKSAILQQDFAAATEKAPLLCTDDGSAGFYGFTTQLLERHLAENAAEILYTCGPAVMMKRVAEIAAEHGIRCYVSMEERMACGVGACLGCVCKTKNGHTRVCADGPVFESAEIIWP
ncbi:MAG: dihydroorotate dehydrogenase electron transfer subunit [Oscillospiraceae bacterium]|nr:dihydroorotate dehydrogenase electron transfer subunit [Oscillospiraceae bacterium]